MCPQRCVLARSPFSPSCRNVSEAVRRQELVFGKVHGYGDSIRKKIEYTGAWARRPFCTFSWSLSPFQYLLLPARLPVPFPQSCCSCKAVGEGFPRAGVTPLAVGSQQSCQRFLCWPVLPRHELQGFSKLPVVLQVGDYRVDYVMAGC